MSGAGTSSDSSPSRLDWQEETEFTIDGIEYACRAVRDPFPSTAERFCLRKPPFAARRYERLLDRLAPERVVELGIFEGGSTALIAQLARPRRLVALDLDPGPRPGLERFIRERGLEQSVRPRWGVDQADGAQLATICEEEFGAEPLDLVIDDASHQLEPSRRAFEALFPRLRPGGEYVLEDWSWAHAQIDVWPQRAALTLLVFELVIASAHAPDAVSELTIDRPWAVIRRGEAELDPAGFTVASLCGPRGRAMIEALEGNEGAG